MGTIVALLLGFALTVHDLDGISLWNDETWTIDATDPNESPGRIVDKLAEDVHPPLYFAELYLWRQVVGETAFELRYFSALLTLLATAVIYAAGRDLFSPAAGLIAALFFVLHDLARVYTQEARHYPQHMLLAALMVWLYWRFWRRATPGRGIAFMLAGAAALWTHYWAGFTLLALAIHALITRRANWRPYALALAGIGLLFAPWLPVLREQMAVERPEGLPHALANSWAVDKSLAFTLLGVPELLWIGLAVAGAMGAFALKRWRPTPPSALPALVTIMPVGLTLLLNTSYPSLSPRSLSLVIPAAALLIGHALAQFRASERALMALFMVAHGLATTSAIPTDRAPWPQVGEFLARHSASGDVTLMELKNGAWNNLEEYTLTYYLDHASTDARYLWSEAARLEDPAAFPDTLRDQVAGASGIWIADWGWPRYDLGADLERLGFVETADAIAWAPFSGIPIETRRYDRPPDGDSIATFGGVLRLRRADIQTHDGWVTVNLLWSPDRAPEWDYTVSAFLLDAGGVLTAQHDAYPFENRSSTSHWQAGGLYFDSHALDTRSLPPGTYLVGVKAYRFTDATFQTIEIAPVTACAACGDESPREFVMVAVVEIR